MKKLNHKWALITGSSRGIGQQIALGLAKEGCNIILHSRKAQHTKETQEKLKDFPIQTLTVSAELGDATKEKQLIDEIYHQIDHIHILYNNAGIMSSWHEDIFSIPMEEWHQTFQVNLYSMIRLNNIIIPKMIENGWGRVINLSSGIKDTPQLLPYSISKAAVDKYTQDLASGFKNTPVLVNALDPGWLKTDMGGEYADHEVETVLPGALVPALLDDNGPSGQIFRAQDYR